MDTTNKPDVLIRVLELPNEIKEMIILKLPNEAAILLRLASKAIQAEIDDWYAFKTKVDDRKGPIQIDKPFNFKISRFEVVHYKQPIKTFEIFRYPACTKTLVLWCNNQVSFSSLHKFLEQCSHYVRNLTFMLPEDIHEPIRVDTQSSPSHFNFKKLQILKLISIREFGKTCMEPAKESLRKGKRRRAEASNIDDIEPNSKRHLQAAYITRLFDNVAFSPCNLDTLEVKLGTEIFSVTSDFDYLKSILIALFALILSKRETLRVVRIKWDISRIKLVDKAGYLHPNLFEEIDTPLLKTVVKLKEIEFSAAMYPLISHLFGTLLSSQIQLETLSISSYFFNFLDIPIAISKNRETLKQVALSFYTGAEEKELNDFSMFQNCPNLQKVKMLEYLYDSGDFKNPENYDEIKNFDMLPNSIEELHLSKFKISSIEVDSFLSRNLEYFKRIELYKCGDIGQIGIDSSFLEKLLELPNILSIVLQPIETQVVKSGWEMFVALAKSLGFENYSLEEKVSRVNISWERKSIKHNWEHK